MLMSYILDFQPEMNWDLEMWIEFLFAYRMLEEMKIESLYVIQDVSRTPTPVNQKGMHSITMDNDEYIWSICENRWNLGIQ